MSGKDYRLHGESLIPEPPGNKKAFKRTAKKLLLVNMVWHHCSELKLSNIV